MRSAPPVLAAVCAWTRMQGVFVSSGGFWDLGFRGKISTLGNLVTFAKVTAEVLTLPRLLFVLLSTCARVCVLGIVDCGFVCAATAIHYISTTNGGTDD